MYFFTLFIVLQVCGSGDYQHQTAATTAGAVDGHRQDALIMKPAYTYHQIFDDDYTDELLNARNAISTPMWHQTLNKQQIYYKGLPTLLENFSSKNNGNSMTSEEMSFENLNDFNSYKIKNAIWPKILKQQQGKLNRNDLSQQQRHSLQQFLLRQQQQLLAGDDKGTVEANIKRYHHQDYQPIPIIMENRNFKTKDKRTINLKTSSTNKAKTKAKDSSTEEDVSREGEGEQEEVKEHLFPLKEDDNTLNVNDNVDGDDDVNSEDETNDADNILDDESVSRVVDKNIGIANSNGNGNENLNYADNNVQNTNYNNIMMTMKMAHATNNNDHNRDDKHQQQFTRMTAKKHLIRKGVTRAYDKRAKPSVGHTPFLPAVSGGN